jgi:ubiquinone/menaquinone biosynthesis C-methylase UbiE
MMANMDIDPDARQADENDRLMRELVELRGQHIGSVTDSTGTYDELHTQGHLCQRDSFYNWLLGLLHPRPGQMLLDVSCGQGSLMRSAAHSGLRVVGLDLSPSAVAMAAQQVPSALVNLADAEQLPYPDDEFDYATNVGSVEHYFHPHRAVREMARVLRPDGIALILLPNTFGLLGNIAHAWRKGDVFDDGQPVQRYGTNAQWRRLLELNGLRVTRTVKYEREWPRTWSDVGWYVRHPHKLLRVFLAPLIPLNLSSFLVYLCQKASL